MKFPSCHSRLQTWAVGSMSKPLFSYAAAEQCSPLIEWVQNIFVAIHISFIFDLLTACLNFWQESEFITCGIRLIFAISTSTQHFSYARKLFLAFDHSILDNLSSNENFIRFCLLLAEPVHDKVKPGLQFPCQCIKLHYVLYFVAEIWIVWCSTPTVDMSLLGLFGLTLLPSCRRWYPAVVQGVPSTSSSFFF